MVYLSSGAMHHRTFLVLAAAVAVNALNLKTSILPQLKRGDTIDEAVLRPREENFKEESKSETEVADVAEDEAEAAEVAEAEVGEVAETLSEKLKKKKHEENSEKSEEEQKSEEKSEEEEDDGPREDPGGPPTVVDIDTVDIGAKMRHFFKREKKYAYITLYLNESLVNETLDKHPRIMTYEQAKQEAFDRWIRIMEAGGQSTKHPPADLYKNVHSVHSPKAHARKGKRSSAVRGVIKLARSLQKVQSKYPLVVVTNEPTILNMPLKHHPNVVIVPWTENFMHHTCHMYFMNSLHFQKLKIFNMTDFEKLMWLDTDLDIKKNVDELFALDTDGGKHIYGQIDDYWMCKDHNDVHNHKKTAYGFCSGMMLFQPSEEHFKGLLHQQSRMANNVCWGDQSLIQAYFGTERVSLHGSHGREIKLFGKKTVSFPYCSDEDTAVIHYSDPQS